MLSPRFRSASRASCRANAKSGSLAGLFVVLASAAFVALGLDIADPLIGLGITLVILKITWDSWHTVRGG